MHSDAMNRDTRTHYIDMRARNWRWWPEGITKLAAWLLLFLILSTLYLAPVPAVEQPGLVPEHATIGLFAGVLAIILRIGLPRVRVRGIAPEAVGGVQIAGQSESPIRWLHYRMRNSLLAFAGWLVVSGIVIAAVSPLAIRLWDTGFDLASIAPAVPWLGTVMKVLHWVLAMLLLAAVLIEAGFLVWRQLRTGDGALVRALPFGILWQRLAAERNRMRERMPSGSLNNWPRGRTL